MQDNIFIRLSRVFRGGPIIKRRVAQPSTPKFTPFGASAYDKFVRQSRELVNYANFVNYQAVDRWSRYSDFAEMESRGELATALNIYADEACSVNEMGEVISIRSDNATIKGILETLFFDTLEIDFHLPYWVRTLCKYGDFALFMDVDPTYGILRAVPIPITDFQRLEGLNPAAPSDVVYIVNQEISNRGFSVQFTNVQSNLQAELANMGYNRGNLQSIFDQWGSNSGQGIQLQDWQVCHFRLLGNDLFLPYGTSIFDPARRLWRLLYMTEDLMLMYRAYRASERRVLYIDTRGVTEDEMGNYMEGAVNAFKREPAIVPDKTGGFDYLFNPMTMSDDYIIPVKGPDSGTKIETLAAGTNTAQIEDVEYLHKQLFATLNMPPAYLGYGEGEQFMGANLSQMHIRFANNVNKVQRVVLQQLYKMAYVHLMCAGFEGEELTKFTLSLASPSNASQEKFLSTYERRAKAGRELLEAEGLVSRAWVREHIMGWDRDEIEKIKRGKIDDVKEDARIAEVEASLGEAAEGGGPPGGGDDDPFGADFAFDHLNPVRDDEAQLITEVSDLADKLNISEEEAYERLRNSSDLGPYPKVDARAKEGTIRLPQARFTAKQITDTPSPRSDAGWDLEQHEDVIELLDELFPDEESLLLKEPNSKGVSYEESYRQILKPQFEPPPKPKGGPIKVDRTDSRVQSAIAKASRSKNAPILPSTSSKSGLKNKVSPDQD